MCFSFADAVYEKPERETDILSCRSAKPSAAGKELNTARSTHGHRRRRRAGLDPDPNTPEGQVNLLLTAQTGCECTHPRSKSVRSPAIRRHGAMPDSNAGRFSLQRAATPTVQTKTHAPPPVSRAGLLPRKVRPPRPARPARPAPLALLRTHHAAARRLRQGRPGGTIWPRRPVGRPGRCVSGARAGPASVSAHARRPARRPCVPGRRRRAGRRPAGRRARRAAGPPEEGAAAPGEKAEGPAPACARVRACAGVCACVCVCPFSAAYSSLSTMK